MCIHSGSENRDQELGGVGLKGEGGQTILYILKVISAQTHKVVRKRK